MLRSNLEVVIKSNHVSVRNLDSSKVASAEAPFSCEHLLIDDIDIFEHACAGAMRKVVNHIWAFPRVKVSTSGRPIHVIERKAILDALLNAGASRVDLELLPSIDEETVARTAYVERAKRKK